MSEPTPQPGDKIEVTTIDRGTAYTVDSDGFIRYRTDDERSTGVWPKESAKITILERADDPANDPIGTAMRNQASNFVEVQPKGGRSSGVILASKLQPVSDSE